ncbi:MAG: glycosyltransferase family A protein [Isosphaeraceae bacterium]
MTLRALSRRDIVSITDCTMDLDAMPRFTIGMPTYNRCDLLAHALQAALGQTFPDVEVLVCDDASADRTPDVVRSFGDRVRYHRSETNIGMWPNFARAVELAKGEYFSWLQDDDQIHRDFVARALQTFAKDSDIVFYSGFALHAHSSTSMHWAPLIGPMFDVNWMGGEVRLMDGAAVAPLLHILNIATPPMIAFRTDVLRRAVRHILPGCDLFNENVIMASVLAEGSLAIDPWVCAFHLAHEKQVSRIIECDQDEQRRQWRLLAKFFEGFLPQLPEGWEQRFKDAVSGISVANRVHLLNWATTCAGDWGTAPATARDLRDMIIETIPMDQRHQVPSWVTARWTPIKRLKQSIKKVTPTALQRIIKATRG